MSTRHTNQRTLEVRTGKTSVDFEAIVENTAEAICQIDMHGKTVYLNRRALDLLGYQERELLGFAFHAVVHARRPNGSILPAVESPILSVLKTGTVYSSEHDSFRRKDGTFSNVSYRCAPIMSDNEIIGAVVSFSDISERILQNERNRDVVAILAHDLKSPLQGAERVLGMLLNGVTGTLTKDQSNCLTHLRQCNKEVLEVVETALDIYRVVKGKVDETHSVVDLAGVVKLCEMKLRREGENRLIRLSHDLPDEPVYVYADEVGLQHVIMNLLGNAIKFTPPGGFVCLTITREEDTAILKVSDSGRGLTAGEIEMLFQPFWQGSLGRKQFEGSGLGLYLCRQIVESFQGSITMSSVLGQGAEVTVELPLICNN